MLPLLLLSCAEPTVSGPLPHDAYLWQQRWTPAVHQAAATHDFRRLWVLGGTLEWDPEPVYAPVSSPAQSGVVVLRVEAPPEGVDPVPAMERALSSLHQTHPEAEELQVDMDLPTRRLDEYALWLERLQTPELPPLSITALPTWLDSPDFVALAQAVPSFVLQVHWLDPADPTHLLDPNALEAIHRAAEPGVPYSVALPAYGYELVLDPQGALIHAAAEQGTTPPLGAHVEPLMADPAQVAELVAQVHAAHPPNLEAWVWFRLPTAQDRLAWHPETLAAVREWRVPRAHARVHPVESAPGLWILRLENTGEDTLALPTLSWERTPGIWDALGDYHRGPAGLEPHPRAVGLAPGESRPVAWVRAQQAPTLTPGEDDGR